MKSKIAHLITQTLATSWPLNGSLSFVFSHDVKTTFSYYIRSQKYFVAIAKKSNEMILKCRCLNIGVTSFTLKTFGWETGRGLDLSKKPTASRLPCPVLYIISSNAQSLKFA
jgi:hypothetical protein